MTTDELKPYAGVLEHWAYSPQGVRELLADANAHYVAQAQTLVSGLEADLREEQDRRQAMRNEWSAEAAALTAYARHAEDCLEAAKARIAELEARPTIEQLEDTIRAGLAVTYHCGRVWSAWGVGTMSEDDFSPVDESDTPRELAESVMALFNQKPKETI